MWQKIYNLANTDDEAWDICQSSDGYFYAVGYALGFNSGAFVLKINNYGDTLWKRIIPVGTAYAVIPTNDGGCVMAGNGGSNAFMIKLSFMGDIVWQKSYVNGSIRDIEQTSDGFYVTCGSSFNAPYYKGCAMKTDSTGNLIWLRKYYANGDLFLTNLIKATNGGYVISGTIHEGVWQSYLLKNDTSGYTVWQKKYLLNAYATGGRLTQISNSFIIGGNTIDNYTRPYFMRTDLNGDTLFTKIFQLYNDDEYLNSFNVINSNRYVFSIYSGIPSVDSVARVIVTDSIGNILVQKIFTYGEYARFHTILPLNNGDIIFAGSAEPPFGQWYDTYIVRTDSNLNAPPIGIHPVANEIPGSFYLEQNYPNPFNNHTIILYGIPVKSYVKLVIYDILGREISTLVEGHVGVGNYKVVWRSENISSGVYFLKLQSDFVLLTRKMILIK
jgi:hypothetical protein